MVKRPAESGLAEAGAERGLLVAAKEETLKATWPKVS
jgi:hypothetical protein